MSNPIHGVTLLNFLRDPAEPEIWISVRDDCNVQNLELRGKLAGPRCDYATTVEVAYPLRPFGRLPPGQPIGSMRVVIPEASFWEPECPFLYEGSIELWANGALTSRIEVSHGIYHFVQVAAGLRLNGKPFTIQAIEVDAIPDAHSARDMRTRGINTLVSSMLEEEIWRFADRAGFFVLGRLTAVRIQGVSFDAVDGHPSFLGWLVPGNWLDEREPWEEVLSRLQSKPGKLLGIHVEDKLCTELPEGISFIYGESAPLQALSHSSVARIIRSPMPNRTLQAGELGWAVQASS